MFKDLKRFYSFLLREKRALFSYFLVLIFASLLSSLVPYLSKLLIDTIPTKEYDVITYLVVFLIGSRLLVDGTGILKGFLGDRLMIPAVRNIRLEIFEKVQNLDFEFHVNKSTGSLISAFKRGSGALWTLHHNLHENIIPTLLSQIVVLSLLSTVDPLIIYISLIAFALNIVAGFFLVRYNIQKRAEFNKEADKISGIVTDNLLNYETVKFFSAEKREMRRLKDLFKDWSKKLWNYSNSFKIMKGVLSLISITGALLILLATTERLKAGQATPGDMVMVITFIFSFYFQFLKIVWNVRNIAKNFTDIERYFSLLDNKSNVKDPSSPKKLKAGEIVFDNVSFDYPQGKEGALNDFNLTIPHEQIIALAGPSGAGKSTIVRLLLRLYDPNQGSVKIDGVDLRDVNKSDLRSMIGIVPQEPILFNNTVKFNIGFGKDIDLERMKEASKLANAHQFIQELPRGYDTPVGERGVKLSGGQKQRVAIARIMVGNPEIIIFDEATSSLDSQSESLIQEALWRVAEGRTVIIIAHRFSTIMGADKIVVLKNGRVVEQGSHDELVKNKGLYKDLWELQVE